MSGTESTPEPKWKVDMIEDSQVTEGANHFAAYDITTDYLNELPTAKQVEIALDEHDTLKAKVAELEASEKELISLLDRVEGFLEYDNLPAYKLLKLLEAVSKALIKRKEQ